MASSSSTRRFCEDGPKCEMERKFGMERKRNSRLDPTLDPFGTFTLRPSGRLPEEPPVRKSARISLKVVRIEESHEEFSIGDDEHTRIIRAVEELRQQPGFTLRIPTLIVKKDRVLIHYLVKSPDSGDAQPYKPLDGFKSRAVSKLDRLKEIEEELLQEYIPVCRQPIIERNKSGKNPSSKDIKRDVLCIKNAVKRVIPDISSESIVLTKLLHMPRFLPTNGLGSELNRCNGLAIRFRKGLITAILTGEQTARDFVLTTGHGKRNDEKICIRSGETNSPEIGVVDTIIVGNGDGNDAYVDAALVRLHQNTIENQQLTQSFVIGEQSYSLCVSQVEKAEEKRVILRAVDQAERDDVRGFILNTGFNVLEGPEAPMYKCIQVVRYREDGQHKGIIHEPGESGLLCTYEECPPDLGNRVKPIVMLTGLYPQHDGIGWSSIGVEVKRIISKLGDSASVGERLTITNIDI